MMKTEIKVINTNCKSRNVKLIQNVKVKIFFSKPYSRMYRFYLFPFASLKNVSADCVLRQIDAYQNEPRIKREQSNYSNRLE